MSLVNVAALAAFAGVEEGHERLEPALQAAEALAAAWIRSRSLAARQLVRSLRPARFRRTVELPDGPLTELVSAELDGLALVPAELAASPWLVGRSAGFSAGSSLQVSYTAGWASEGPEPPAEVIQALLLIGADQLARGSDPHATATRLGDYEVSRTLHGAVPREAEMLLRPWRRP